MGQHNDKCHYSKGINSQLLMSMILENANKK